MSGGVLVNVFMRPHLVALLCLLGLLGGTAYAQTVAPDDLSVAGSPEDYWKAASLTGAAPPSPRFLVEFIRAVEAMEVHDPARLDALHVYLDHVRRSPPPAGFTVVLPLRADVVRRTAMQLNGPSGATFAALMRDRRLRRLIYGAAALEPDTRRWFEQQDDLLEKIARASSGAFAEFGRSLRVRNGAIEVPGGPGAADLWERLTGEPVTRPTQFATRLLTADNGLLASFYDAVAHLDAPRQRFALGAWMPDRQRRWSRFSVFYNDTRILREANPIPRLPFSRSGLDLFSVLSSLNVMEDGRPAAPASMRFWQSTFATQARTDQGGFDLVSDPPFDAAWFTETVLMSSMSPWEQVAPMLFAQRLFARAARESTAIDATTAHQVIHRFRQLPALMLALERSGLGDVATYRTVLDRASTLSTEAQPYRHRVLLMQFQGALALIEQLKRANRLTANGTAALLTTLSQVRLNENHEYGGEIARWIDEQLMPAIGGVSGGGEAEATLLEALAGVPADKSARATLEWEDWTYQVDPSLVPVEALKKIRRAQGVNSLDSVLSVWRATALLQGRTPQANGDAGPAVDSVKRALDSFVALQNTIVPPRLPVDGTASDVPDVERAFVETIAQLTRATDARQLSRAGDAARRMQPVVDFLTGHVLVSLVYATHIRDASSPLLLSGDVSYKHDFGLLNEDQLDRVLLPWWFPVERNEGGWHVRGSLLGLDVGLARLRLPQVATGGPPAPPVMTTEDQQAFLEAAAIFASQPVGDEAMHAVAAALRAGRARVVAATADPGRLDAILAEAGVSEWRRYTVAPLTRAERPTEIVGVLTPGELYWLGLADQRPDAAADNWGASPFPFGGCQCLRVPPRRAWEDLSGRNGHLPSQTASPLLRLAELLTDLRLPSVLARHILPVLMRDFLDQVRMVHSEDWGSVERFWAGVRAERVEDIVAQLTVGGPLIAGDTR